MVVGTMEWDVLYLWKLCYNFPLYYLVYCTTLSLKKRRNNEHLYCSHDFT